MKPRSASVPSAAPRRDATGPADGQKDERRYCRTAGPCGQIRHAQTHAGCPGLLLRAIEVQKAQQDLARAVVELDDELAAPAHLHAVLADHALDLHRLAVTRLAQRRQTGFVLVAQRQVQGQVDVAHQAQPRHGELRRRHLGRVCRRGLGRLGGRRGAGRWRARHGGLLGRRRT